jgi:beta-N-acetylhexosaminidase
MFRSHFVRLAVAAAALALAPAAGAATNNIFTVTGNGTVGPGGDGGPATAAQLNFPGGPAGPQAPPGATVVRERLRLAALDDRLRACPRERMTLRYRATVPAALELRVLRGRRTVARTRGRARAGRNRLRPRAPRAAGRYTVALEARAEGQRATDRVRLTVSEPRRCGKHGWIVKRIQGMTLEEKVGQLFVANVYGESADTTNPADVAANQSMYGPEITNAVDLVDRYRLGGVVYFRWTNNLNEPSQIARLSNGIQRVALDQPARIPMLIATDQEHGVVSRVWAPATEFPGSMALGATRRPRDAFAAAGVTAEELAALGINQNYAPVADVNVNPLNPVIGVRSFGEQPRLVSRLTAAAVRGTQRVGVSATLKHFPGHGDTVTDSHTGVPWIFHTRRQWERTDAPPFRAGISAGVDMVMTAHVVMPELQSDCDVANPQGCDPATLDREILTGLLRKELGFDGVVVADALNMAGVREKYGDDRVPVLALKAGVDMPMMIDTTTDTVSLEVAYQAVLKAVRSGELSERWIDRSVSRVLELKLRRGLFVHPFVDARKAPRRLGTPGHRAAAARVANHSVTLIKNDSGLLPLTGARKVLVTGYRLDLSTTNAQPAAHLAAALGRRGVTTDLLETGSSPDAATIDAAVTRAGASDVIVVATANASGSAAQRDLVNALIGTGKPVVLVAARNPYDIAHFAQASTYVASYSWAKPAMQAVARVLLGRIEPAGRLPVRIPATDHPRRTLYPYGHGLSH